MKTSIAAIPFLILAAQAAVGFHRPTDCCMSYTPRNIRCVFMEDYIQTSSACSRPAVIFVTKQGQRVCADPNNERVQKCKSDLSRRSASRI